MYIAAATARGIYFWTDGSSATKMRILANGNVGIGTSSPVRLLDLYATTPVLSFHNPSTTGSDERGGLIYQVGNDFYVQNKESSGILGFIAGGNTERMRITSGGNVSIGSTTDSGFRLYAKGTNGLYVEGGTSNSNSALLINNNAGDTQYLRVRGDGYLFSTPTYNNTWAGFSANMYIASDGSFGRTTPSSGRYKDNINDWNGKGLETILALKPKTFKYKKDYCETADIDFLGLIAEEVSEVSPYLAQYENVDRTGLVENVRYDIIVVPLISAIQELKAELDELKALINK
jgi:hypothetical protein